MQGWRAESSRPTRQQHPSRRSEQSGRGGRALRAPTGWQPFPFMLQQQVGGSRKAGPRLYARKRVLKGKRVIDKREKTAGCLPLARSAAAHTRRSGRPASNRRAAAALSESEAANQPAMHGQFRYVFQGEHKRASARSFAPLRMTIEMSWRQKGVCCNSLQGPLRQRLTALPPPLEGEAGWGVQTASVGSAHARDPSSLRSSG